MARAAALCGFPPARSTSLFWITIPLWITVTRAASASVPSGAKRGARKTMSYACHSPGGRLAFASGGYCP